MFRFWNLRFRVYKNLVNDFRVYVLGFKHYDIGFGVRGLGLRFYNTLINCFNKHLNKSYITLSKML